MTDKHRNTHRKDKQRFDAALTDEEAETVKRAMKTLNVATAREYLLKTARMITQEG